MHIADQNPFLYVPVSQEESSSNEPELVVSIFHLWLPIVGMMLAVGTVTGMLFSILGVLVAFAVTIFVTLPISLIVVLLTRVAFPRGVSRREAARCGMAIGAITATCLLGVLLPLLLGLVSEGHFYLPLASFAFILGQAISGSWGAKSGFDHLLNLVAFGRNDLLGKVIRTRPRAVS